MPTFGQLAELLLAAVSPAIPPVDEVEVVRKYVATGPDFAVDCPLLVVSVARTPVWAQQPGTPCAIIPSLEFVVTYAQDCAPGPDGQGNKPTPEALTGWAVPYLNECDAVWSACADFVLEQGCDTFTLGDGTFRGPTGRMVSYRIPLTWTALAPAPDPGP